MNSFKVIWTENALDDLLKIRDFISKNSESEAIKQLERIFSRESQLSTNPESGTVQLGLRTKFEIRYLVQDNYKILYRLNSTTVFVQTIFDTRQNPKKLKPK
ncbi:MAG: type II toxin-antitoxin system RelE/ParE family toxin [Flavobacteriales bacterium]|nr:type II toxin-antitoxin system RelE/ParE family toxin [Flavobacteriales bacterium]